MVALTFKIERASNGDTKIEVAADTAHGSEFEKRLAGCLDTAVTAAMQEVLKKVGDGVMVEKAGIAKTAREVMKKHLDDLPDL